ncbi:MAG: hypothetical protein ACLGSH_06730 [Acidobacteriota bacterium]
MISFSNIWKHPRTSVAGVLISVATVAGVLAQQGVTLGTLGGGSVVSLAAALATALLGLLAHDPGAQTVEPAPAAACNEKCAAKGSGTAKLSAWLLIVLLAPLPWLEGCTAKGVAQDIVNWTPSLQSAVATVDSTVTLLAPADAALFAGATAGFDAASNLLAAQARAYLDDPSASTLAKLQAQVVSFQQQVNAALLTAARIVDPASQQHAAVALQAVATIVGSILALLQSVSTHAEVAQMAAGATIKLAEVTPYMDNARAAEMVAAHYSEPVSVAEVQVARVEQEQIAAGF